ncbi:MAG: transporter [[Eubacterium] sulci]|nr:transporter [[Eubacterium] sulci]
MQAIAKLFPVFFVLLMGLYARKRNWISHEQNDGIKSLALGILFPFLIYNIVADASLDKQIGVEIVYLIGVWIFVYFLGRIFCRIMPKELSELSPFLLLTCEGGAVALPLYISVVGSAYAVNLIPFDLAGILVNFIFVPTVLQLKQSNKLQFLPLVKNVVSAPFVIAAVLGFITNLTGLQDMLLKNEIFGPLYENTIATLTAPIAALILFSLGYSINLKKSYLMPLVKLAGIRILFCTGIIASFFLLFPSKMANPIFLFGVLLYFYCPTGFPVPLQIKDILDSEEKEEFVSAFISMFLLIALAVYVALNFYFRGMF